MILDVLLPGAFLLGILVFLHEAGHFLVAKLLKVPVYRFSLGFGPALAKFTRGETTYQVSALPLGGYVSMAEERTNDAGEPELVDRFGEEHWWKRVVIALAGPAANCLTGLVAVVIALVVGISYPDFDPTLGPMPSASRAATGYGLVEGTRLVAVDGHAVATYQEFLERVQNSAETAPLALAVAAPGGAVRTVTIPAAERTAVLSDFTPPEGSTVVGNVVLGTPAYLAGLQPGDRVVSIQGAPVRKWGDLIDVVSKNAGNPLDFTVDRGGRLFHVTIKPEGPPTKDAWTGGKIGVEAPRARTYTVSEPLGQALAEAPRRSLEVIAQTFRGLWTVFTRPLKSAGSLGGPQMIMQIAAENAKRGAGDFIWTLAVISFAIMAFNLLPLPVLDGGHVFLAAVEAVRRRPPTEAFTTAYQRVGLVFIGCFFVFVVFNDLNRFVQHRVAVQRNSNAPQGEARPAR
jgi:regulator of sigma E protease